MFEKGSVSNVAFCSIAAIACLIGCYITGSELGGAIYDYLHMIKFKRNIED